MFPTPDLPAVLPLSTRAKPRRHAQWLEIVDQWRESGLSEQAFCDSIGVRLDTFRKHRYQANKVAGKRTSGGAGFRPVKITKVPAAVEQAVIILHAPGCRVELPGGMDVGRVAELVRALGR